MVKVGGACELNRLHLGCGSRDTRGRMADAGSDGWAFIGPHHWRGDQFHDYDLLRAAPADMKVHLEGSIKRWQVQRLTHHLP
eukprot:7341139-Pyramimonas_sp.AAC.1